MKLKRNIRSFTEEINEVWKKIKKKLEINKRSVKEIRKNFFKKKLYARGHGLFLGLFFSHSISFPWKNEKVGNRKN